MVTFGGWSETGRVPADAVALTGSARGCPKSRGGLRHALGMLPGMCLKPPRAFGHPQMGTPRPPFTSKRGPSV